VSIEIRQSEQDGKGGFTAWDADAKAGTMSYSRLNEQVVIIDHTETSPGFEGRGVGRRLVTHGVEWAREHDQQLMPLCPFAKSVFDRMPEWQDVRFG
jgi:hypothetical protein